MIELRWTVLLVSFLAVAPALSAEPDLKKAVAAEDLPFVTAYVQGKATDLQVDLCRSHVRALAPLYDDLQARVHARDAATLAKGEAVFRKTIAEAMPEDSPDAVLAKSLEPLRAQFSRRSDSWNEEICVQLRDTLYGLLDPAPAGAPAFTGSDEVVGSRGTFAFSQVRYARDNLVDPFPLAVNARKVGAGDEVTFSSPRRDPQRRFDVKSWPTGDAAWDMDRAERVARGKHDVQSVQRHAPCLLAVPASSCLTYQRIDSDEEGPFLATETVVFQAGGWTYAVTANSFIPHAVRPPGTDPAAVPTEPSMRDASTSLVAFLAAFTPRAAPLPGTR